MNAYKEYMDRISLDEEQQDRLMEAILAAEAAEAEKTDRQEAEITAKVRRFPLKRFGWIASAAAVIVLLVAVFPKGMRKTAELTASEAAFNEIEKPASLPPHVQATQELENHAIEEGYAPAELAAEQDFSLFIITPTGISDGIKAPSSGKEDTASYCGTAAVSTWTGNEAEEIPEDVGIRIREMLKGLEVRLTEADADRNQTSYPEVTAYSEGAKESGAATETTVSFGFIVGSERFEYDDKTGLLRSGGKEYLLTEDERIELNSLLERCLAGR